MPRNVLIILLCVLLVVLVLVELAFFAMPSTAIRSVQQSAAERPLDIQNSVLQPVTYVDPLPIVMKAPAQENARVLVKGEEFEVVVARTDEQRQKGLSGHASLGDHEGMLFVFDEPGRYGFWMKNMAFAIDIIWLDGDGRVTHIAKNTSPDSYPAIFSTDTPSRYVLEVSSGTVERLELEVGERILW